MRRIRPVHTAQPLHALKGMATKKTSAIGTNDLRGEAPAGRPRSRTTGLDEPLASEGAATRTAKSRAKKGGAKRGAGRSASRTSRGPARKTTGTSRGPAKKTSRGTAKKAGGKGTKHGGKATRGAR